MFALIALPYKIWLILRSKVVRLFIIFSKISAFPLARSISILIIFASFYCLFWGLYTMHANAQSSSNSNSLEDRIKELEGKIRDAQNQAQSLSREINIIQNTIELRTIQIKKAEEEIEKKQKELGLLGEDIKLMELRLDRLDERVLYHQTLLSERMREQYIDSRQNPMSIIMAEDGVQKFISHQSYLERIQAEDRALINRMNATKISYEDQQDLLEDKRDEVEKIKDLIESQKKQAENLKAQLEQQKQDKDNLLRVTKNNESRYKELLESAKKELTQIQGAATAVIREGKGVKVKEGETIGTMGNSGYSTGAHLHFGVYKYSKEDFEEKSAWGWYYSNYVNPLSYLKSKTIKWDTGCYKDPKGDSKSGTGDWTWPMLSPRITQSYGSSTCYNWMYGGKAHPALDMVGIGDISIRAVADGEAYFCRNCLKDGGNGVFIFHDDDMMTVYWHLK